MDVSDWIDSLAINVLRTLLLRAGSTSFDVDALLLPALLLPPECLEVDVSCALSYGLLAAKNDGTTLDGGRRLFLDDPASTLPVRMGPVDGARVA